MVASRHSAGCCEIDLTDSKGQYFLIMFGEFIGPLVSSIFWLLLYFFYQAKILK